MNVAEKNAKVLTRASRFPCVRLPDEALPDGADRTVDMRITTDFYGDVSPACVLQIVSYVWIVLDNRGGFCRPSFIARRVQTLVSNQRHSLPTPRKTIPHRSNSHGNAPRAASNRSLRLLALAVPCAFRARARSPLSFRLTHTPLARGDLRNQLGNHRRLRDVRVRRLHQDCCHLSGILQRRAVYQHLGGKHSTHLTDRISRCLPPNSRFSTDGCSSCVPVAHLLPGVMLGSEPLV